MAEFWISLQWDKSQLGAFREQGLERAVLRALAKAGGDAIRAVRTSSQRSVRFRKRMKVGRVIKSLQVEFPSSRTHLDDLVWRLRPSAEVVPVSEYPFRQIKRGVSVAINKGKRKVIKSAFVATMKSGHVGIFVRRGKARLPIDEAFTTRVSDVFRDSGMIPAVLARGQAVFASSFDRLLPIEIEKARKAVTP